MTKLALVTVTAGAALALLACQPAADAQEANAAAAPASSEEEGPDSAVRAVRYGLGGPEYSACMTQGVVTPGPDAPVLAAPDSTAAELEQLAAGHGFMICEREEGEWRGIVYPTEGNPYLLCETNDSVQQEMDYPGPCRSGWIAAERVEETAG